MARQQRSTTSFQESTRPITQVALYARVSTLNNQDPEMQLAELREYAGRRGWQVVEEFTDQGVSGCKESRPALNRLMSDACRRRFDAILVWKIDRFGRSLKHLVNALAEVAALGVAFISLRDNLDLSTPVISMYVLLLLGSMDCGASYHLPQGILLSSGTLMIGKTRRLAIGGASFRGAARGRGCSKTPSWRKDFQTDARIE